SLGTEQQRTARGVECRSAAFAYPHDLRFPADAGVAADARRGRARSRPAHGIGRAALRRARRRMIVTPSFVFLHLHKSGGTFVNTGLMRLIEGARHVGYHLPRSMIPPQFASLPVLGLVRDPWSYYVSWYSSQRARPRPNALFQAASHGGTLDFKATVRNMLNLG